MISVNDEYSKEIECFYKGERYSVRDNGAILCHGNYGTPRRKLDFKWTFGRVNENGYMTFRREMVHRIVATAFHGNPPASDYVVDHIDTNRQNNRPENLRWLTPLENILCNPISFARILYRCGSIESFLKDPSVLSREDGSDYSWMRAVTPTEAKNALDNLMRMSHMKTVSEGGTYDDWIFSRRLRGSKILNLKQSNSIIIASWESGDKFGNEYGAEIRQRIHKLEFSLDLNRLSLSESINKNAMQESWNGPCNFLLCPSKPKLFPLLDYAMNLESGNVFLARSYGDYIVERYIYNNKIDVLFVVCKVQLKDEADTFFWPLVTIGFKDGKYIHRRMGEFFYSDDVEKVMALVSGFKKEFWIFEDTQQPNSEGKKTPILNGLNMGSLF